MLTLLLQLQRYEQRSLYRIIAPPHIEPERIRPPRIVDSSTIYYGPYVGTFAVFDSELYIESRYSGFLSWQGAAEQYDYYRIFRIGVTIFDHSPFADGEVGWTFATKAHKSGYQKFYPSKVDWPGAVLDIGGTASEFPSAATAGRVINALDVSYSGLGLWWDYCYEHHAKRHGYDVDLVNDDEIEGFVVDVVGILPPPFWADIYSLYMNWDELLTDCPDQMEARQV